MKKKLTQWQKNKMQVFIKSMLDKYGELLIEDFNSFCDSECVEFGCLELKVKKYESKKSLSH